MWRSLLLSVLFLIPFKLFSQSAFTGNIYDNQNRSMLLEGVTVRNLSNKAVSITNRDGHFALTAKVGDLVSFSMLGYQTDTLYLINLFPKNIYLRAEANQLKAVDIRGAKLSPFLDLSNLNPNARPARAVDFSKERGGLRFNLGYGKYRRQQEKEQELEEMGQYIEEINRNFSPEFVKKLLKIDGEDLKNFMDMYRPTIEMVKAERPFNYELYTARQYSHWIKLPPGQRKVQSVFKSKGP